MVKDKKQSKYPQIGSKSNAKLTGHSKVVYSFEEGERKSSYELLCNNFKAKNISEVFLLYNHL